MFIINYKQKYVIFSYTFFIQKCKNKSILELIIKYSVYD